MPFIVTRSATKDVSLKNNNLHLQPLIKSLAYHEEVAPANQLFHLAYKRASVLRITTSLVSHRPLGKQLEEMVLPLPLLLLLLVLMMGGRVTVREAAADLPPTFGPHSYEVRCIIKVLTGLGLNNPDFVDGLQFEPHQTLICRWFPVLASFFLWFPVRA